MKYFQRLINKDNSILLLILAMIFSFALILRLWGVDFGLPYEYHVDEVQYVRQGAKMGQIGLDPTWWNNPPFMKYILFFEYAVLYGVGNLLGLYPSPKYFGEIYTYDPTVLYLLGRGTVAIFGAITVLLVWFIGRKAYNKYIGLTSAWFLAVCFLHVRDSHYAVNDVAVTFFTTIVLLAAISIVHTAQIKWYIIAGVGLGLGFATKYTAILTVVPVLVAHFFSIEFNWKKLSSLNLKPLIVFGLVTLISAIIASPFFILSSSSVVSDISGTLNPRAVVESNGVKINYLAIIFYYLRSMIWANGWLLAISTLLGLLLALVYRKPQDLVLLSYIVISWLIISTQRIFFARFLMPILPPMLLLAASGIVRGVETVSKKLSINRYSNLATILIIFIVSLQPLINSIYSDILLTRTDTRTLAKQWIEANIPEGSKIAIDWRVHSPQLSTSDEPVPDSNRTYDLTFEERSWLSNFPLEWYRNHNYDYIIVSSFVYGIGLDKKGENTEKEQFYSSLDRELELVKEIYPNNDISEPPFIIDEVYGPAISLWQRERPGPIIKIYRVN